MTTTPTPEREHEEDPLVTAPVVIDHDRAADESMGWLTVPEPAALTALSDPRRSEYVEGRARPFVALALATALVVIVAVAVFNRAVDPLGEFASSSETSRKDVLDKLALIEGWDRTPDTVILGSSVVMKWDPKDFQRITGRTAFNAGVTGAMPSVYYAFAKYVEELHPKDMPNLVIGLSHFSFHSGQDAFLQQDERLKRQISGGGILDHARRYGELASFPLAETSVDALRARAKAKDAKSSTAKTQAEGGAADADPTDASYRKVDKDGFLLRQYPTDPAVVDRITQRHAARYRRAFDAWAAAGGDLNADQRDYFERLIALANAHDHVPAVVLTQINPKAVKLLADTPLEDQERRVYDYLRGLQEDGKLRFELVDMRRAERFGSDVDDFYDATHITKEAAARIMEGIHDQTGF